MSALLASAAMILIVAATQIMLARRYPCRRGHDYAVHLGGRNAGCELGVECHCSVPVMGCSRCDDCDYGDNAGAVQTMADCAEEREWR